MTPKKMFINICLSVILFSLFVLFFLKPKYGAQFEVLENKSEKVKSTPSVTPSSIPSVSPATSPEANPSPQP